LSCFCTFVKGHLDVVWILSWVPILSHPSTCLLLHEKTSFLPFCLPGYSAKQEFLFLTTVPEVGKLPEEKHFPEELQVGSRPVPSDMDSAVLRDPCMVSPSHRMCFLHLPLPSVVSTHHCSLLYNSS
jgi:hypothetical protein